MIIIMQLLLAVLAKSDDTKVFEYKRNDRTAYIIRLLTTNHGSYEQGKPR